MNDNHNNNIIMLVMLTTEIPTFHIPMPLHINLLVCALTLSVYRFTDTKINDGSDVS